MCFDACGKTCGPYGALIAVSDMEVESLLEVHVVCLPDSASMWLQVREAISSDVTLVVVATIVIFCVAVLVPRTSPLLNVLGISK